jgi:hypothetical protein
MSWEEADLTQIPEQSNEVSQLKRALLAIKEMKAKITTLELGQSEPLAVIGMACRFPGGANSPEAFWKLLMGGVDAISEVPHDRWSAEEIYAEDFLQAGKANTRWGGFLEDIDQFDPAFLESRRVKQCTWIRSNASCWKWPQSHRCAGLSLEQLEGSLTECLRAFTATAAITR